MHIFSHLFTIHSIYVLVAIVFSSYLCTNHEGKTKTLPTKKKKKVLKNFILHDVDNLDLKGLDIPTPSHKSKADFKLKFGGYHHFFFILLAHKSLQ